MKQKHSAILNQPYFVTMEVKEAWYIVLFVDFNMAESTVDSSY